MDSIRFIKLSKNDLIENTELDLIFKDFNIKIKEIEKLETSNKYNYILDKIKNVIKNDLKFFSKKNHIKNKVKNNQNLIDKWIKVKTKYQYLKPFIKMKIVQLLGNTKNREKIERIINDYKRNEQSSNNLSINEFKSFYKLKTVKKVESIYNKKSYLNLINLENKKLRKKSNNEILKKLVKLNDNVINVQRYDLNKASKFEWEKNIENNFLKKKKQIKNLNKNNKTLLKDKYIGISEILLQFKNKENSYEIRNELLDKYMGGEFLTEQELRYLTYTNDSLSKLIDFKFYKNAIKIWNKKFFKNLELEISKSIWENYVWLRKILFKKRNNFLKSKIKLNNINKTKLDFKYLNKSDLKKNQSLQKIYKKLTIKNWKKNNTKNIIYKKPNKFNSKNCFNSTLITSIKVFPSTMKKSMNEIPKKNFLFKKINYNIKKNLKNLTNGPQHFQCYKFKNKYEKNKAAIIIQKYFRMILAKRKRDEMRIKK